jgi:hypothetical protein
MKLRWPVARVVLIRLILVGAVMVGIGVKALLDGRRFTATAVEARGIVVEVANVGEYDSDLEREVTRPYPVVEFVTAREQVVRYQPPWAATHRTTGSAGRSRSSTTRLIHSTPSGHLGRRVEDGRRVRVGRAAAQGFNAAMYLLVRSGR